MAEDIFNPEVQPVGIPDSTNATRPISRPMADESKGKLFAGIGQGVKEAGDIIKEGTKLKDFTDKEFLSNSALIATEAERQGHIGRLEDLNAATGTQPSMMGLQGGDSAIPDGLKPLAKKAGTLAAAKADEGQLDVYYKARIADLAKSYRTAYPQYRDYIDHVFSKMGYGNPANEYVSSLQRQFLKNQAVLQAKDTQATQIVDKGMTEFGHPFYELAVRMRRGEDVSDKIFKEYADRTTVKSSTDAAHKELELGKATGEARKDAIDK